MKSQRKAPTPEGKMQVDTSVKTKSFGPKGEHLRQSVKYAVVQDKQVKRMDIIEQDAGVH